MLRHPRTAGALWEGAVRVSPGPAVRGGFLPKPRWRRRDSAFLCACARRAGPPGDGDPGSPPALTPLLELAPPCVVVSVELGALVLQQLEEEDVARLSRHAEAQGRYQAALDEARKVHALRVLGERRWRCSGRGLWWVVELGMEASEVGTWVVVKKRTRKGPPSTHCACCVRGACGGLGGGVGAEQRARMRARGRGRGAA